MNSFKLLLVTFLVLCGFNLKAQVIPVNTNKPTSSAPAPAKKLPAVKKTTVKTPTPAEQEPEVVRYTPPVVPKPSVTDSKYNFFFFDNFSGNTNSAWSLVSDAKKEITIDNGKFRIKGINSQFGYRSTRNFEMSAAGDFTFAITTKWAQGVTNEPFGVDYCGQMSSNSYYNFSITANGYYIIRYYKDDGKWTDIKGWTKSNTINQNTATNILSIRKSGSYLSFAINAQEVESLPFDGGYGSAFGLRAEGVQTVDFDNFTLTGIKQTTSGTYTPQASNNRYDLTDNFSDNSNNWPLNTSANKEMKIENGKLRIRGIADGYSYDSSRDFDIDMSRDLDLSVTAKWIEGIKNRAIGLVYGGNGTSYHSFVISADGSYLIAYFDNGSWKNVKEWTESSFINKNNTPNILSIKKRGNNMTYYINGNQVESLPFNNGYGNIFGVRVGGAQTIDFDNFTLSGVKGTAVTTYTPSGGGNTYTLFDDFSDNRNSWAMANDNEREMKIDNGKFRIKGISNERSYKSTLDFNVNANQDFTLSVTTKWVEGIKNKAFGLVYCGNASFTSHCDFTISANGSYTISYYDAGGWKDTKAWTESSFVNQDNSPNILSIKKAGNYISFYINDHAVETIPFDGGYGSVFGLRADGAQTIDFDNFTLNGTKKQ